MRARYLVVGGLLLFGVFGTVHIAAQDPADPGVLVLSRFAGAAEQLREALLVNPYDTHGTAETVQQALQMPLEERRERHQKLLARMGKPVPGAKK